MMVGMERAEMTVAAEVLRAVADGVVRAEDVTSDPIELAYLHGAVDALELASDQCPDFLKVRRGGRDGRSDSSGQGAESQ